MLVSGRCTVQCFSTCKTAGRLSGSYCLTQCQRYNFCKDSRTMLTRICRIKQPGMFLVRRYTAAPYGESYKKLRGPFVRAPAFKMDSQTLRVLIAFPFKFSPEEAQRKMAAHAALLCFCDNATMATSVVIDLLPSFLSTPSFLEYKRPTRFSAVYFPAWILNAEIEAKVTYKGYQQAASAIFRNTYIPGSHVPTLSAAPLWPRTLDGKEPLPFDESLLRQYEEEVQCIPFTISPFSVVDIATTSSAESLEISPDLSFSPSSVKPTIFSAFPVLLPLYVGQYTVDQPEKANTSTVTVFMQAHSADDSPGIMTEGLSAEHLAALASPNILKMLELNLGTEVVELPSRGNDRVAIGGRGVALFSPERAIKTVNEWPQRITKIVYEWLEDKLRYSSNIEKLASLGKLKSDDDPRVREMTEEETEVLDKYFKIRDNILFLKMLGKALPAPEEEPVVNIISSKFTDLEEGQKQATPHWWIEHEQASSSKSTPSDSQ
ncbi:hypothetical protein BDZ97DRAFT_214933 [Flammula alnicola]|nr:hypothetical protein BDZ97DRAFT_214933 [Flammula alnicola]